MGNIERALQRLGYKPGKADGYPTDETEAAIAAWRKDNPGDLTAMASQPLVGARDKQ